MLLLCILAGRIRAMRDLWLIGDQFLFDMYPTLPELKNESRSKQSQVPYIYEYLNVSSYVTNPLVVVRSKLACILNALISALNEAVKLPRLIVVIPDTDLLEQMDFFSPGKTVIMGLCFEYLVSNFEKSVHAKKDQLRQKRPGSVINNEPKIIWTALIPRKGFIAKSLSHATITFNESMEEVLSKWKNYFFLKLDEFMDDVQYFTSNGQLSGYSKVKFWQSMDKIIEGFDKNEVSLHPQSKAEKQLITDKKVKQEKQQSSNQDKLDGNSVPTLKSDPQDMDEDRHNVVQVFRSNSQGRRYYRRFRGGRGHRYFSDNRSFYESRY